MEQVAEIRVTAVSGLLYMTLMETSMQEVNELEAEVERLEGYEPARVKKARQKAARTALYALCDAHDKLPKSQVRIGALRSVGQPVERS